MYIPHPLAVNFHVVLGLRMPGGQGHEEEKGPRRLLHKHRYWSLFKMLATDVRYRAVALRQLGLFPTFFGQDISGAPTTTTLLLATLPPTYTHHNTHPSAPSCL